MKLELHKLFKDMKFYTKIIVLNTFHPPAPASSAAVTSHDGPTSNKRRFKSIFFQSFAWTDLLENLADD